MNLIHACYYTKKNLGFYARKYKNLKTFSEQHLIDCGFTKKQHLGRCSKHEDIANGGDPQDVT
jgi:hypothetical protein